MTERMKRRGQVTLIREAVPCAEDDGGCGAAAGEMCTAHRDNGHGPASGKPGYLVHAARWRAWLRTQPGGKAPASVPEGLARRFASRRRPPSGPAPRIVVAGGSGDWDYGPLTSRATWHGIR